MRERGKRLSILLVGCGRELAEQVISELGIADWQAVACPNAISALDALKGQRHYDLILTSDETIASNESEWLQQVSALNHLKSTPVVILDRRAGAGFNVGESGKLKRFKQGKRRLTEQMKGLAASALANKVGYLQVEDFPDQRLFDDLPAQSYGPHKVIRCKLDELLLVRRGLIEVWQTHHDLLVKRLMIGTLFGEMPLLGQTMVITQAVAGDAGATLAVLDVSRVKELIKANALALAEKLYPRLAAVEAEHYRAIFQTAEARVAARLLELVGDGSTIEGLTQWQLGEQIGIVRETVLMAMAALKAKKLIGVDRRKVILFDKKALAELSRS
jgi:CRP-like cAMP-binding protein